MRRLLDGTLGLASHLANDCAESGHVGVQVWWAHDVHLQGLPVGRGSGGGQKVGATDPLAPVKHVTNKQTNKQRGWAHRLDSSSRLAWYLFTSQVSASLLAVTASVLNRAGAGQGGASSSLPTGGGGGPSRRLG
eukprot:5934945-Pyramimonas_sp.AAC.1